MIVSSSWQHSDNFRSDQERLMQRTACNSSIFGEVLLRKISEMFSAHSRAIFTPEAMRSRNLVSTCSTVTQMRNLVFPEEPRVNE